MRHLDPELEMLERRVAPWLLCVPLDLLGTCAPAGSSAGNTSSTGSTGSGSSGSSCTTKSKTSHSNSKSTKSGGSTHSG